MKILERINSYLGEGDGFKPECRNYDHGSDTCRPGCKIEDVSGHGRCPFSASDDLQRKCGCYS